MAAINGTNVGAPVVPGSTADEFPTHIDKYGAGGYRAVQFYEDLSTIPALRRVAGMRVFVLDSRKDYYMSTDLTTWLEPITDGGNF